MKTIKKRTGSIALLCGLVILLQSCMVYKKSSVTLEKAVQEQQKVRVEYEDYESYRYQKLISKDGTYFGVKKEKGELVNIPIDENRIVNVRLYNKSLSNTLTIVGPIVILGGVILILASSVDVNPGFSGI